MWLRNFLPFTVLSALLSALLLVSLVLDGSGLGSAALLFNADRAYGLLVLKGLTALLAPMISARVVQSFDGVDVSLARSIRLSGRGIASTSVLLPFQGIVRAVSYVLLQRDSTGNQQELAQVFE